MSPLEGNLALTLLDRFDAAPVRRDAGEVLPAVKRADIEGAALVRADREAGPPPKFKAIRNERWLFVRACEDLKKAGQASSDAEAVKLVVSMHRSDYQMIADKLSERNLRQWRGALGKHRNGRIAWDNRDALTPDWATGRRQRKGDALFWQIFAGFYEAEEQVSMPIAYELACASGRRSGITNFPSVDQVRRWYDKPDVRMRADVARNGEEWAKNRVVGHITRSWEGVAPNEVWFGDHHVFDCAIKVADGKGGWKAERPWLTAWMDGRSLALVGWVIREQSPNHVVILEALRNGILVNQMHCAQVLYTDQGGDYKLNGFTDPFVTASGAQLRCVDDLGCSVRRSEVYRARTKTVERMFGVVCGEFSKLWPSYLGNRPEKRPDKANYYWSHAEELPTRAQFIAAFEEWLGQIYHRKPRKGSRILNGMSSEQAWAAGTGGPALSIDELRLGLAVPYASPTVREGGVVVYQGVEFRSRDLWPFIRSQVVLRIDRVNGAAFACDLTGRLLCELEIKPQVDALAQGDEQKRVLGRELADQRRQLKALKAAIDEATGGTHGLSAIDRLQIDWSRPFEIEERGQVKSIRGPAHIYRHIAAVQDGQSTSLAGGPPELPAIAPRPAPKLDDETAATVLDFQAAIMAAAAKDDDEAPATFAPGLLADPEKEDDTWAPGFQWGELS